MPDGIIDVNVAVLARNDEQYGIRTRRSRGLIPDTTSVRLVLVRLRLTRTNLTVILLLAGPYRGLRELIIV